MLRTILVICAFSLATQVSIPTDADAQRRCRAERQELRQSTRGLRQAERQFTRASRRAQLQENRFNQAQATADRAITARTNNCARRDSNLALRIDRLEANRAAALGQRLALLGLSGVNCLFDPRRCQRIERQLQNIIRTIARIEAALARARAQRSRVADQCQGQLARLTGLHANRIQRAENNFINAQAPLAGLEQGLAEAQQRFNNAEQALNACLADE